MPKGIFFSLVQDLRTGLQFILPATFSETCSSIRAIFLLAVCQIKSNHATEWMFPSPQPSGRHPLRFSIEFVNQPKQFLIGFIKIRVHNCCVKVVAIVLLHLSSLLNDFSQLFRLQREDKNYEVIHSLPKYTMSQRWLKNKKWP